MEKIILTILYSVFLIHISFSQTIFSPSGTIGTSSNANVGIGVNNPSELLEVRKDQNEKTRLRIANFNNNSSQETGFTVLSQGVGFDILSYNSSRSDNLMGLPRAKGVFLRTHSGSPADRLAIGTGSSAPMHFATADAVRMTINPNGNIGVGTKTASSKLHVFNGQSGTTPHGFSDLTIEDDEQGMISILTPNNQHGYFGFADSDDSYVGGMQYEHDSDKMVFRVNNHTYDMSIASNGYVGIGTLNPNQLLEVIKHQNASTRVQITNNNNASSQETGLTVMSQGVGFDILSYNSSRPENLMGLPRAKGVFLRTHSGSPADRLAIGTGSSAPMHFATADVVRMTINPNGNIGVGTQTTGSHKLAVEGSIGAREIKVEANGWSDFVFENDYNLRTLEEVEQHISEKGHLPEIPSEAEVAENGINLGEMNAKLLQKIEELTLYMIDVNKRVNQLETENTELKEKIVRLENN
ncbi:MAG: hypothetical protein KI790_11400 [Cyclobacteriaceae bacterium]|nr:hypothetical protein [Cyclobacteriaceae bacterium HetDA_MAG_MS6]